MVVVDHGLTKGVIYCPCHENIDVAGVAQLFFLHVFPQFGLHRKIISDRGPQFTSAFTRELACLLEYDVALSTAYHPQTVTVLFPHRSILLFFHTRYLLTWRGRRIYTNTSYLFIRTVSSFCFFDLSTDLANS